MPHERLEATELQRLLAGWPEGLRGLALDARRLVLHIAPALDEKVAFHVLCYYRGGVPYGVIGGNVCLVGPKRGRLYLSFLHGAFLPDPERLLSGQAKSKRELEIRTRADLARPAIEDLLRAAVAFDPAAREADGTA